MIKYQNINVLFLIKLPFKVFVVKEVSYAHYGCIYLIKKH